MPLYDNNSLDFYKNFNCEQIEKEIFSRKRCVDCGKITSSKLGCIRDKIPLIQCQECFNTFALWYENKITNEQVVDIYINRFKDMLNSI